MEAYDLQRELGRGAFGVVHLAARRTDGELFAIKILEFDELGAAERQACLREAQLLSRLRHPNVIGFEDAALEGGKMHIVMEHAGGGTLEKELAEARTAGAHIAEDRLLDLLVQLASALHYMHACRVVHRDVKPANIFLAADGTPKLADVGISQGMLAREVQVGRLLAASEASASGERGCPPELVKSLEGTPYYLSPELIDHKLQIHLAQYSPSSDVWALGVTMYELACLERPFSGDSLPSLAYKIATQPNVMHEGGAAKMADAGYSAELCAAVESMLHKEPSRRATLSELLGRDALASWAARRSLRAPPPVDLLEEKAMVLRAPLADAYAWGRGGGGVPRVREELMGVAIRALACGADHCAAVTDDGGLLTWGESTHGQLGHGDRGRLERRRRVLALAGRVVVGVACGHSHTLAWDDSGELYGCGDHSLGQLGLGEARLLRERGEALDAMNDALVPVALPPPPGADAWARAACGETHSAALAVGGAVLSWGVPDDGRLGIAPLPDDIVWLPTAVEGVPDDPVQIACGDAFTAVLTASGELWAWGSNLDGQLGLGDDGDDECESPRRLLSGLGLSVAHLACGTTHMAALDDLGALWVWGDRFGATPRRATLPRPAADAGGGAEEDADAEAGAAGSGCAVVACGAGCVLAVSVHGECFVWGEGTHGRLGLGDDGRDHEEPQRLDALSAPRLRVHAAALGRGEQPRQLALATPDSAEAFSAQFRNYFLASSQ